MPKREPETTPESFTVPDKFTAGWWDNFYRLLDQFTVTVDLPTDGESIPVVTLQQAFIRVQDSRARLDRISRKVERRLGEIRRSLRIAQEVRRIEEAERRVQPDLAKLKVSDRDAIVRIWSSGATAKIAALRALEADFEAAQRAVGQQRDTLEAHKQTLNAIKSLMLEHRD